MIHERDIRRILTDLTVAYKQARQKQYDAEWEGNKKEAELFKNLAEDYKKKIDEGELYEPSH